MGLNLCNIRHQHKKINPTKQKSKKTRKGERKKKFEGMAMEAEKLNVVILFVFVIAITIPTTVRANIADFDDYWQQRAAEATKAAHEAYHDDPIAVTEHFNKQVLGTFDYANNTRRNLKQKYKGPCMATNPIDRCWRCDPNWEKNRKRLADCALGFGRKATGGKLGPIYVVTDNTDADLVNPKPGTLRHAVIQNGPLWIIFARDMRIKLTEELLVASDKTIDARGANVHILDGAQISLQFVKNVIISNLHIHNNKPGNGGLIRDSINHFGQRTRSDGDGISMYGATNVWIDHLSLSNCADGLIDAIQGSTAITISNCHLTNHNDVMLFGSSDSNSQDQVMQITLAFNHFGQGLVQRMPRCRWGFFHVVNNDYTHWLMYAIGGSQHPTIISQGNRFIAPLNQATKEVTHRNNAQEGEWRSWNWRSENDLMMNGAFFVQSGSPIRNLPKADMIQAKPGSFVTRLTRFAGPLKCIKNKPC